MTILEQRLRAATTCPLGFDNLTRQLYATDASLYQLEPLGVAFPRTAEEAAMFFRAAADANVEITPRGAGTGLVGGAIGQGIVVDFARHNRVIGELNLERRTIRVGAGVVLDQLNNFLKPHGLQFGPDVATSSRATIGGMIANNSSGSYTPVYGTTAAHVLSLEVVTTDGRVQQIGREHDGLATERDAAIRLIGPHADEIVQRMPADFLKRWPGFAVDRWARAPGNLCDLLAGSEGTLAGIVSAELKLVPLPSTRGVGLLFFHSVTEAMQASVELLDLQPAAVEHVDHTLLGQTRGQLEFKAARDLLRLDDEPCEAILIVEFFEHVPDKLAELSRRRIGARQLILKDAREAALIWNMRKAGLSLLTSRKGAAKPVTGIEDTAVRPEQLADYVGELQKLMARRGLEASFYGHAASGLLHVRPVLELHSAEDRKCFREIGAEVSALVRQFKGSMAAEHGVGMARTEFMREHLGDDLLELFRQIKSTFDPHGVMNPGKLIPDGRYGIDQHLRFDEERELRLPFSPVLAFAAKDDSFIANLEQCNGCGGCLKSAPTMCPTFVVTGDEIMSTRGRANTIRAVLEGRAGEGDALNCAELEFALSNCLSCKACATECPSNVNLPLLKAELVHARHQQSGVSLREWLVSNADLLGRIGCAAPTWANAVMNWTWVRAILRDTASIAMDRALPAYAAERFDKWFVNREALACGDGARRSRRLGAGNRLPSDQTKAVTPQTSSPPSKTLPRQGKVILWDDTFVRYHEPEIGKAAVRVLEAAGFGVVLPVGRACCGRPAFSQGRLDMSRRLGQHNLQLLARLEPAAPVLFLEPSCYSMFAEDYRELKLAGDDEIRQRCWMFEEFIANLLAKKPGALKFNEHAETVVIHAHCHAKSLRNVAFMASLANRLPGRKATLLPSGCCGMAGVFGMSTEKVALSESVAGPLLEQLSRLDPETVVIASGTSCRQQISQWSQHRPLHFAEWLAEALS
jgi:FAD/FMN-containing dehydrogenase/Fe-S oxidoreductase